MYLCLKFFLIILLHFQVKNTLKNKRYHTSKYPLNNTNVMTQKKTYLLISVNFYSV